ncbi:MAG TPA: cupin domain-containing protein [Gaiellaceae bacterium]
MAAHLIPSGELPRSSARSRQFEGEPYNAAVSFFLNDNGPGEGPGLHTHPYPETWIVRDGRARFAAGEEEIEASPGDIVVVEAGTPHGFKALGPGRLEMVCIHAAGRMVTEWL